MKQLKIKKLSNIEKYIIKSKLIVDRLINLNILSYVWMIIVKIQKI